MLHSGRGDLDVRSDAKPVLQKLDHVGTGNELGNGGQVVERIEAELLEEDVRRSEQYCLARPVVPTDLFDVATCRQRANHAVRIHAANGSDLGPRDRLLVRNDSECLQSCARKPGALIVEQEALDVGRQVGRCLVPKSTSHSGQFKPIAGLTVGRSEFFAPLINQCDRLLDELRQHFRRNRVVGNEDDGFNGSFER